MGLQEIMGCVVCSLILQTSQAAQSEESIKYENRTSAIVNRLLERMDARVRPHVAAQPVAVKVDCHVITLGSISEVNMDITIDILLRLQWQDPRLEFEPAHEGEALTLTARMVEQLWTPDIFFPNEKEAYFHHVTVPNRLLKIHPDGTVIYGLRVTLKTSCPMNLKYFPMDRQNCLLKMESYSYEDTEMTLNWMDNNSVSVDEDMELPEMKLVRNPTQSKCKRFYKTGPNSTSGYDCLEVSFLLEREYGYFVLQTYLPSVLIVVLSWVSFWINKDAVPARITLGVTTVLTMTTQLSGSKAQIPKVSYPKAIDVWMSVCMFFVFTALIEYAFVNALLRKVKHRRKKPPERDENGKDDKDLTLCEDGPVRVSNRKSKNSCRNYITDRQAAQMMDNISRVVFPVAFLVFNGIYWTVYLHPPEIKPVL